MADVSGRAIGPVEYIVFAFAGNEFKGEIVPELLDLIDTGLIRVIDLAVVSKDEDENVTIIEASDIAPDVAEALDKLGAEFTGMLSEADLLAVADDMPAASTAAAILFEHVWAARFVKAVRNANGWVVASARIPADVVEAARESLIEAAAEA